MGDKLFLKGGPNLRPFPKLFLTKFIPALLLDSIALTAFGRILRSLSDPLSFPLTYFFRLFRTFPITLFRLGYVWTFDFVRKVNGNGQVYLLQGNEGLIGYQRISIDGNEKVWDLRILVMVHRVAAIIRFVPIARAQGHSASGAWSARSVTCKNFNVQRLVTKV